MHLDSVWRDSCEPIRSKQGHLRTASEGKAKQNVSAWSLGLHGGAWTEGLAQKVL